jgi:hypothetical protein
MIITNGAYFQAKVFHAAYEEVAQELTRTPMGDWDSLSKEDQRQIAGAFQLMTDVGLIEPLKLSHLKILRQLKWWHKGPS